MQRQLAVATTLKGVSGEAGDVQGGSEKQGETDAEPVVRKVLGGRGKEHNGDKREGGGIAEIETEGSAGNQCAGNGGLDGKQEKVVEKVGGTSIRYADAKRNDVTYVQARGMLLDALQPLGGWLVNSEDLEHWTCKPAC